MAEAVSGPTIGEEEQLRANWYAILGWVLSGPPGHAGLDRIAELRGDGSEFGRAIDALAAVARDATPEQLEQEYFELFVGVGRAELLPYGSYYLTGFLHEKPLARLRADLAALGIARADGVKEPEDHIASLCEAMSGLIRGSCGAPASLAAQRRFFDAHIGCWAPRFFADLEGAQAAAFYRPVGALGRVFLSVELTGFEMAA